MRKFYEVPEIELHRFEIEDVITSSNPNGGMTLTPDSGTLEDSDEFENLFGKDFMP